MASLPTLPMKDGPSARPTPDSGKPFPYPPLPTSGDGLRLLGLYPGSYKDPLQGSLVSVPFSSKPKYLALSYTWNLDVAESLIDTDRRRWIELNGKFLEIGANLHVALIHLRSNEPLTLWVDQVCINQADVAERNAQVALMAFIFTRASTVVSWLGRNRAQPGQGNADGLKYVPVPHHSLATGKFAFSDPNKGLQISEMDRYWTRVWVVQEVCLARSIVFLVDDALWSEEQVTAWMRSRDLLSGDKARESPMTKLMKARSKRFTNSMRLEALIEQFMHCGCGELRDRVYGLAGLANDVDAVVTSQEGTPSPALSMENRRLPRGRGEVPIDYQRSLYQIWCDTVSFMHIRAKAQPDCGKEPHEMEDERRMKTLRFAGIVQIALDGKIEEQLVEPPPSSPRTPSIRLKGYVAGTITHIGPTYSEYVGSFRHQQRWLASLESQYTSDIDLAKLREMEEKYEVKILEYRSLQLRRMCPILSAETVAWSPLRHWGHGAPHPSEYADETETILDENRDEEPRRFLGDNHCMGLAPCTARLGDIVVRFWNCDAAILLRSIPRSEGTLKRQTLYRLVGRADIAENYTRTEYDHQAKEMMGVFNVVYNSYSGKYEPSKSSAPAKFPPRTNALYIQTDFPTLQKISAAIGI